MKVYARESDESAIEKGEFSRWFPRHIDGGPPSQEFDSVVYSF
jgi:hypothetical protein